MKKIIFNEDGTLRGSFINLSLTFVILVLVCLGAFNKTIAVNLKEMTTLIVGFFGASFGIWQAKAGYASYNERKIEEARHVDNHSTGH